MSDDYTDLLLNLGKVSGQLHRAELFGELVVSLKTRQLKPAHIELLRDKLDEALTMAGYPPLPEQLT